MRIRTFLVVVCLHVVAAPAFAQQPRATSFGVVGSVNGFRPAYTADHLAVTFERQTGGGAGVFVIYPAGAVASFQPELQLSIKRTRFTQPGAVITQRYTTFDIPFLLRIAPQRQGPVGFHVLVGPALSFRLSAGQTVTTGSSRTTTDVGNALHAADVLIVTGAGVDVKHLLFDFRYYHGLRAVNTDRTDNARVKTRTIAVMAGLKF